MKTQTREKVHAFQRKQCIDKVLTRFDDTMKCSLVSHSLFLIFDGRLNLRLP